MSLSDVDGLVKHLEPGTYAVVVHDRSAFHNFHLFGPGVDVSTTVDGTGDQTFTVTLADGTYTYQCDAHVAQMKVTSTVGTVSAAPPPAVTKLSGSITGSKATLGGTAGLSAGKAQITVADRSKTDGFVLRGPGVAKQTGGAFTGTVTWTVTLRAGTYRYGSATRPAVRTRFTVSAP
jgi:hypothetical protein